MRQILMLIGAGLIIAYGFIRIYFVKKPKRFCECPRCGHVTTKANCPMWLGRRE